MYLKIDNFTELIMKIKRTHKEEKNWDDKWCEVTLEIKNEYFNYKTFNNELLLESEIEILIKEFNKLVNGKLLKNETIEFIEPDLVFILEPSEKAKNGLVDMRVNLFQDGALSADYYNLCLDIEEVKQIMGYLNNVIPTVNIENDTYKNINDSYCIVLVKYDDYDGDKTYAYILNKEIDETKVGDKVLVDRAGNIVIGTIINKNFYDEYNAPYPVERTKTIIKRLKTFEEYKEYDSTNDICEILYSGTKEEIEYIIKELDIEYSFSEKIPEYSIKIKRIGAVIRGKRSLKANYNCIKYFGCKCDSNNLNNKENKLIIGYYGQAFFGGGTYIKLSMNKSNDDRYKIEYLHSAVPNYIENAEDYITKFETIDIKKSMYYNDYKKNIIEKWIEKNIYINELEVFVNSLNLEKIAKRIYNDDNVLDGLCWDFYILKNNKQYKISGYEDMPKELEKIIDYLEKIVKL